MPSLRPLLRLWPLAAFALLASAFEDDSPSGAGAVAPPPPRRTRQLPPPSAPTIRDAGLVSNTQTTPAGTVLTYDYVPRHPDLPAEYARYQYPIAPRPGHSIVLSGFDLDKPDAQQRRAPGLSHTGHGGVDLAQERGAPVHVISLRGEVGNPVVLFADRWAGTTVALLHHVQEGNGVRPYVALHGHLDSVAPGIARGQTVSPGTVIGFVGDTGAHGMVHLHYELRFVRTGVDPMQVDPPVQIVDQRYSVPCDPRNLLPLAMV